MFRDRREEGNTEGLECFEQTFFRRNPSLAADLPELSDGLDAANSEAKELLSASEER